ncbi:LOW QUALITY PROTEIN: Enzymatic Polyprotein [Phytophthora megakarya]|uniref:Enzymatic Polyprotein n=1 Tax=Phytophthora megakarya TaxID=4795 RepID=A0A225VWU5_9STRA|nr:LOW QUALITY PROTEIN: Enzymatic Polyprotein [Phytophthora megakarya]
MVPDGVRVSETITDMTRGKRRRSATATMSPRAEAVIAGPRETVPDETREPEQVSRRRRPKATTTNASSRAKTLVTVSTPPVPKSKSKGEMSKDVAGKDVTSVDITTTGDAANDFDGLSADDEPTPVDDFTLQLTDDEIETAQQRSKFVRSDDWQYGSMTVEDKYGLVTIDTANGRRVVLPPTLWTTVFKEMRGSVWSGHLRGPHTYSRVAQLYWWSGLSKEIRRWVRGCQECGSRNAKPREVIPTLRSLRGGAVCFRSALDVAGPFPIAGGGERYVVAAVEYVTRYAVACCVTQHTAESVAAFLMQEVVLRFGAFRELLTDGAPEMTGKVIEDLVTLLQAQQVTPVPYRPQLVGLVERFHRTWKDCVATFMQDERQTDWNLWVKFAVYSYNSAQHSTVARSPNDLMMDRRLRAPNELLRRTEVAEAEPVARNEEKSRMCGIGQKARAGAASSLLQPKNKKQMGVSCRRLGMDAQPATRKKATKFVHQWMGPLLIVEPAGFDNFVLKREDKAGKVETIIAHVSFLISYHYPEPLLDQGALDIDEQIAYDERQSEWNESEAAAPVLTATISLEPATTKRGKKRVRTASDGIVGHDVTRGLLVERRRRRRQNRAGQYVLEYERSLSSDPNRWETDDKEHWLVDERARARWIYVKASERLHHDEQVMEDPWIEEEV